MKHYFKCWDCLATACVEVPANYNRWQIKTFCGLCGGPVRYMGEVQGDKWTSKELLCKCDERCTHARGPKCECQCGGENHGSGMAGYYEHIAESGKVKITPTHAIETHKAIAAEWNRAKQAAELRLEALPGYDRYKRREWISEELYRPIHNACAVFDHADEMKTHKDRMRVMATVAKSKDNQQTTKPEATKQVELAI